MRNINSLLKGIRNDQCRDIIMYLDFNVQTYWCWLKATRWNCFLKYFRMKKYLLEYKIRNNEFFIIFYLRTKCELILRPKYVNLRGNNLCHVFPFEFLGLRSSDCITSVWIICFVYRIFQFFFVGLNFSFRAFQFPSFVLHRCQLNYIWKLMNIQSGEGWGWFWFENELESAPVLSHHIIPLGNSLPSHYMRRRRRWLDQFKFN